MKVLGLPRDLLAGAVFFTVGMWCWATRLTLGISDSAMLLPLALTGLGAGWQIGPLSTLINSDTPPTLMGEGPFASGREFRPFAAWQKGAMVAPLFDFSISFFSTRTSD